MPSDEGMSIDERRKYLKLVAPRYVRAKRSGRSKLLTEIDIRVPYLVDLPVC